MFSVFFSWLAWFIIFPLNDHIYSEIKVSLHFRFWISCNKIKGKGFQKVTWSPFPWRQRQEWDQIYPTWNKTHTSTTNHPIHVYSIKPPPPPPPPPPPSSSSSFLHIILQAFSPSITNPYKRTSQVLIILFKK